MVLLAIISSTLLVVLAALVAGVLFRDLYPRAQRRLRRRHRASAFSDEQYIQAVNAEAVRQLRRPKIVRYSEETRLLIVEDLRNRGGNHLSFSYPHAMLAKGVAWADRLSPNEENVRELENFFARVMSATGGYPKPSKVEDAMMGEILIHLYERRKNETHRVAIEQIAQYLLARARKEQGVLAYRPDYDQKRFVDTLGMVCPFLSQYGVTFNQPEAIEVACQHALEYIRHGTEPRTGLPYHAYSPECGNRPIAMLGWGRGVGWYTLGLSETIHWIPAAHPARPQLEEAFYRLTETLLVAEKPGGGWEEALMGRGPYESSATAMITYALCRVAGTMRLPAGAGGLVERALQSLKDHTTSDGTVDFAQGDTRFIGLYSHRFEPAPYAQGMALAAMCLHQKSAAKALKQPGRATENASCAEAGTRS